MLCMHYARHVASVWH